VTYTLDYANLHCMAIEDVNEELPPEKLASFPDAGYEKPNERAIRHCLSVVPKQPGNMILLRADQLYTDNGISFRIPSLDINRVVPNDSPIFELVEKGKISELKELVTSGRASLRDHDEYGASLLQVSYSNWNSQHIELLLRLFSMQASIINRECVSSFSAVEQISIIPHRFEQ
jgi:hypothetical protein